MYICVIGGLITLPGAKPALEGTPGMIGYGMAKAAVHHLTKSLGASESGLPQGCVALALLPITLDTPMNRKWMPKADTSKWTPLEFISESVTVFIFSSFIAQFCILHFENIILNNHCRLLFKWSLGNDRPANGSLVSLVTNNNVTQLQIA